MAPGQAQQELGPWLPVLEGTVLCPTDLAWPLPPDVGGGEMSRAQRGLASHAAFTRRKANTRASVLTCTTAPRPAQPWGRLVTKDMAL